MKKLLWNGLLVSLLMPGLAAAQSAFEGTWKIDMNKAELAEKPDVFLLQDGMYECETGAPPIKVKADGQDQTVTGDPYRDPEYASGQIHRIRAAFALRAIC